MDFKNPFATGVSQQHAAEKLGLTDTAERRVEDTGKPAVAVVEKDPALCVVQGCNNPKAPGQTFVCTKHIRTQ